MFKDQIYICNYYNIPWNQRGILSTLDVNKYLGLALGTRNMCFVYLTNRKGRSGYFVVKTFLKFLYKALAHE